VVDEGGGSVFVGARVCVDVGVIGGAWTHATCAATSRVQSAGHIPFDRSLMGGLLSSISAVSSYIVTGSDNHKILSVLPDGYHNMLLPPDR
jgi:hypothetical protein